MSIKIYEGRRVRMKTLAEARTFAEAFRAGALEIQDRLVRTAVAACAARHIDGRTCGLVLSDDDGTDYASPNFGPHDAPISYSRDLLRKRMKAHRASGRRDVGFDFDAELCLIAHKGQAYLMLFAEDPEFLKLLDSLPGVEEYGYWDNVDRPDGVSAPAWARRGRNWDAAIPSGIPGAHGLTIRLECDPFPFPGPEDVAAAAPDFKERAAGLTMDLGWRLLSKAMEGRGTIDPEERLSMAMRRMNLFAEWRKGGGKTTYEALRAIVESRLVVTLRKRDFLEWPPLGADPVLDLPPIDEAGLPGVEAWFAS